MNPGFLAAILTSVSFAMSAICGTKASRIFGGLTANWLRLSLAGLVLGIISFSTGDIAFGSVVTLWFIVSGVVGFGFGDVALYEALPALGSRLTLLINFCSAPLFAASADFLILGRTLSLQAGLGITIILCGVWLALYQKKGAPPVAGRRAGLWWALGAGLGQGLGASLSRIAEKFAAAESLIVPAYTAAFYRILGGLVISLSFWWYISYRRRSFPRISGRPGKLYLWLVGAALFGPMVGVSLYQSALKTLDSAVVLAIIATSPIWVIPLAYWLESDKPRLSAIFGAVVAVSGVVLLALARA